jgi:hypothetical protein
MLGFAAAVLTTGVVAVECLSNTAVIPTHTYSLARSVDRFGLGVGIFICSLAGQACLPVLYDKMAHPESYPLLINVCFLIMMCVYGCMGTFGYLRYGDSAEVLVTSNLVGVVSYLESLFVVANCASTIAPLVAVISDVFEETTHSPPSAFVQLCIHTAVFAAAVAAGVGLYLHLNNLESLIGGLGSMVTSLIAPALCYLKLCWRSLSLVQRAANVTVAIVGIAGSVFIVASNIARVR